MPLTEQDRVKLHEMLAEVSKRFYTLETRLRQVEMEHFKRLFSADTVILTPEGQLQIENKEL